MIYLGTDIVDINRIRDNLTDNPVKFLDRIFTEEEIKYCTSKTDPAIHFAGRFAGKEAIKKAILSSGVLSQLFKSGVLFRLSMKDLEIRSLQGIPKVYLGDTLYSRPSRDDRNSYNIEVSISHTDNIATATAILTDK